MRDHHRGQEIFRLLLAQTHDIEIVRRAFNAAVPREVFVHAIAAVFAVGVVVLVVVRDEIPQRETIVACDEVERLVRQSAGMLVEVGTAANARCQSAGQALVAAPESADIIAITAIPFRPPAAGLWKTADLIQARGVPRLGDQLGVAQQSVLRNHLDDGRIDQHVALAIAAKDGGEIEAQAIDVHFADPETQASEDEFADDRMVAVDGIAAPGEVEIVAALAQQVIKFVIESAKGIGSAAIVAFAGVVEDDVENDLDVGLVKGADEVAELGHLVVFGAAVSVSAFRGGKGDAVVTPKILEALARVRVDEDAIVLIELEDGEQFDRGDAELLQIGNFLDEPGEGPRLGDQGIGVHREAAHVQFVDDGIFHRQNERHILAPVVGAAPIEAAAMGAALVAQAVEVVPVAAPVGAVGDRGAAWVEQDEVRIEAMSAAHGSVNAPAVAKDLGRIVDMDMPKIAGAMGARIERDVGEDLVAVQWLKNQLHGGAMPAHENEVDALRQRRGPERRRSASAGAEGRCGGGESRWFHEFNVMKS